MTIKTAATSLTGRTVVAPCGCHGTVSAVSGGQFPTASVRILVPCPGGHPVLVAAGVIERWPPTVLQLLPETDAAA